MACGGGTQERVRSVEVPIRAMGKCPSESNADRFQERACNEAECAGDEVCMAKQDLIIAIDGSGSMREGGFETIRKFAANLTGRYESTYQGIGATHVGVLLFGQGTLEADGTIGGAKMVHALSADVAGAKAAIEELEWQRGITNMAQAFTLADRMLREHGRADAQSAVLVLTDGKPSMKFVTGQKVKALKEKGAMIYMAPISEYPNKEMDLMKEWASMPWETNYERIPGLQALDSNFDLFASRLIAKFCPLSFSPSRMRQQTEQRGYMLLRKQGYPDTSCASFGYLGTFMTADSCYASIKEYGFHAFTYTHSGRRKGTCYVEHIDVTSDLWNTWLANMTDPECPNGAWEDSPFEDTYAVNPAVSVSLGTGESSAE
jgi:hypothetical protein